MKKILLLLFFMGISLLTQIAEAAFYDDSTRYIPISRRATADLHGESRSFYLDKNSAAVMSITAEAAILDVNLVYVSTVYKPFGVGANILHIRYFFDNDTKQVFAVFISGSVVDDSGNILVDENGNMLQFDDLSGNFKEVREAPAKTALGRSADIAYQLVFGKRFK